MLHYNPDIVIITETWLHSEVVDTEIVPPGYTIVRHDRSGRGGGVAIVVKNHITFTVLPCPVDVEALWIRIQASGNSLIVGAFYRPPNADDSVITHLQDTLARYHANNNKIILAGDFNMPDINWNAMSCSSGSLCSRLLFDICLACNLTQVVTEPTRVTDSSSNVLDLVFVSEPLSRQVYDVKVCDGISDHKLILFQCKGLLKCIPTKKTSLVYDFTNAQDVSTLDYFEFSFDSFLDLYEAPMNNVDQMWNMFRSIVHHCLAHFIPKKKRYNRKHNPWITREIIHLKRKMNRLLRKRKRYTHIYAETN